MVAQMEVEVEVTVGLERCGGMVHVMTLVIVAVSVKVCVPVTEIW